MSNNTPLDKKSATIYQRRMEAKRILAKEKFSESYSESAFQTVPIKEILMLVRKAHSQAGIILETNAFESFEAKEVMSNLGKPLQLYRAIVPFIWVNPDNPEDKCETRIEACVLGTSSDDKFISKLYTSALKIMYRIEYNISGSNTEDIDMILDANTASTKPSGSVKNSSEIPQIPIVIKPKVGIEEAEEVREEKRLKVSKKED